MVDQLIADFSTSIKAEKINQVVHTLRGHCPRLVFEKPYDQALENILLNTPRRELFHPEKIKDENFASAVVSGLLIWNDCEEEAHSLAQNIPTSEGSYFHAIIHRREPDIWNSGYWFGKVGEHPVFPLIYDFIAQNFSENLKSRILKKDRWDPELFNKVVEEAQKTGNPADSELTKIQHAELLFLIAHSYRHTIGS